MNEAQVVRENEDLVQGIRKSLSRSAALKDDLLQEGRIALVRAARSWEAERKVQFRTYAATMVRNAMVDFLRKQKPDCESMDEVVGSVDGASLTLHDVIGTPATQDADASTSETRRAGNQLSSSSRREVVGRVLDGASLQQIATERATTRFSVRRTLESAYPELRALLSEDS